VSPTLNTVDRSDIFGWAPILIVMFVPSNDIERILKYAYDIDMVPPEIWFATGGLVADVTGTMPPAYDVGVPVAVELYTPS
jgi:hypothetical protein